MAEPTQQAQGVASTNSLIAQGSSELQIILHPLVLLTISDYITRHTLRQQQGPIVGALLGQQNGRTYTIEHAFEVHTEGEGDAVRVHEGHFRTRLEQMITVHKDRSLDFVGWYTLLPPTGPTKSILPLHQTFLKFNESALLLGFHPEETVHHSVGGKLPLTIYESIIEMDDPSAKAKSDSEDKIMADGSQMHIRFRELGYSVETHETEMISMNYVAGGGGSAAAKEEKPGLSFVSDQKGKRRIVESEGVEDGSTAASKEDEAQFADRALTKDEEEMLASLTTKANAIKMLQSRINVLATYLERLPPSFTSSDGSAMDTDTGNQHTAPSNTVLRQIQALVNRLDLVIPSDKESFEAELLQEANNVNLVSLLSSMMQGTQRAREVNQKSSIIEGVKHHNQRMNSRDPTSGIPGLPLGMGSMSDLA